MKKLLLCLSVILVGCHDSLKNNDDVEMFNYDGMKGKSNYLYFININEGYSFNHITKSEEQTEEQLNDPNFFPKSTDIAIVYKTTNGGKNWNNIYSVTNRKFSNIGMFFNNILYVGSNDFYEDKSFILKKENNDSFVEKPAESLYNFLVDDKGVSYVGKNKIVHFDIHLQPTGSLNIDIGNKSVFINGRLYTILRNREGHNYIREYIRDNSKNIYLSIEPEFFVQNDVTKLLIAGQREKNTILLVDYDINTKKVQVLQEFGGYSMIQSLQSNDQVICGFIGNIKGAFIEYDLFYSLDKGKTWHIQELKEKSHIHSNALINNVLYILSGGNRMQRIILQ